MKRETFPLMAIITICFMSLPFGCENAQNDAKSDVEMPTGSGQPAAAVVDSHSIGDEELTKILEENIEEWNTATLATIDESFLGFEAVDALPIYETATAKDSGSFEFVEIRENGRTVYKNDENETVKYNIERGYWKFISPEKTAPVADSESLTNWGAQIEAEDLFSLLGLPVEEKADTIAVGIGVSTEEQDALNTATAVGRHVVMSRRMNEKKVLGSSFVADYNLDGSLQILEIRWPVIELPEDCVIASKEEFISKLVSSASSDFNKMDTSKALTSSIVYYYDEENGVHIPAIQIFFQTTDISMTMSDLIYPLCKTDETHNL